MLSSEIHRVRSGFEYVKTHRDNNCAYKSKMYFHHNYSQQLFLNQTSTFSLKNIVICLIV